ncbi:MAG: BON domain-containing protein [Comamonadaceae bacterium]|nr:MAG: BON domain-containing protein [Comamonadaceae bacterium]
MKRSWLWAGVSLVLGLPALAQERVNTFGDPFEQVTAALPGCPAPRPPGMTVAELRDEAHVRSQHGGSGRPGNSCRLPNSYLYDKEIIPRVSITIRQDCRFNNTSVWALGERRLVTLMGCVGSAEESAAIERAVGLIDDVMGVVNHLMVGTQGTPLYPTAGGK